MSEITQAQKTALLKIPGFKDIQKQFAKESKMAGSGKRRMKGRGFWEDVGNWFVQAGKDVNQFLKDTKLVSNVAAYALPILGAMGGALLTVNPLGATAGGIAGKSAADYIRSQGYGKMRGGELSNKLVISPPGQRLMGRGESKSHGKNGVLHDPVAPARAGIMQNIRGNGPAPDYRLKHPARRSVGMGGLPYGSISSEFGNVKF